VLDNIVYALHMFWPRTKAAFGDPARRRHVLTRSIEGVCGGVAAVCSYRLFGLAGALAAPIAEYLVYEYAIEPLARLRGFPSWAGPYWERGPRDGETFINE
jgi:hypothetical protein